MARFHIYATKNPYEESDREDWFMYPKPYTQEVVTKLIVDHIAMDLPISVDTSVRRPRLILWRSATRNVRAYVIEIYP